MKKTKRGKKGMRHMTFALAGILLLMQPVSVCATALSEGESQNPEVSENTVSSNSDSQEAAVQLITEIEALSEEQSYYSYGEKPDLTQLTSDFPEELSVKTENAEEYFALPVTWECEDDYEGTESDSYLFYPKWDESLYELEGETELPFILVEIIEEDSWKMIPDIEQAKSDLHSILQAKSVMALVYLCDTYTVKAEASEDAADVASVASGQSVLIQDVALGTNGNVWYQVLFYEGEKEYKGYVERGYLITSDTEFCEWEETHIDLSRMISLMSMQSADIEQFPASYQTSLYRLKEAHPNWVFVRMDTGLDWNTVILNENKDARNLVSASRPNSWKNGQATQGWYHATEAVLKYYMDPRNFLSDPYIFQFEQLTYNPSYHTSAAVQGMLNGSFMSSTIPEDSRTYAQAFEQIGKELGVSPFHLSSRVLQEQGKKGTSALISGTYSGFGGYYKGYYNYFNVGAWGETNAHVIENGLKRAKAYGWDTRYKSLYGGAKIIGNEYILRGQDTLYLQKFNVSNGYSPNYTHQYMQNVEAPYSESQSIRKAYNNAGVLDQMFVFKIPVYRNMPAAACSKPDTTDTLTLNKTSIDSLAVNQTQVLIPYVNGSLIDDVSAVNFESSDESVATVSGDGRVTAVSPGTATITCRRGNTTVSCTVTVVKANPSVTIPAPLPVTYSEELKLSDIDLPAGWAWVQGSTVLAVGTATYEAVYTPSDTTKYNTIEKQISLTVTKEIPDYQVPEGLQADYGDELGTIALPAGFAWEDGADTKIEKTGEAVYYVSYNPDEKNYYTIDHIPVRIKVIGGGTSISSGSTSTTSDSSTGTSGSSTSTPGTGTPSGSTGTGTTSGTSTSTSGGSTSTGMGTTSGTSTSTSSGSTSTGTTSGQSTSTSGGSTSTSTPSSGTSTSSSSTSTPSTGTPSGTSTSTSSSSTSTPNTGTTSGTSTSTPSTSTPSTGTPSGTSTSTSSGSTGTTSGTSTSTPGSSTSTSSTGTPSGTSTGTSGGSTSTLSSSTSTLSTSTTSGASTSTSGGSTNTPSTGTISTSTPSSSTSTLSTSTPSGTSTGTTNSNTNSNTDTGTTNNTDTATPNNTDTSNNNTDTPNTNTPNSAVAQNGGAAQGTPNASNVGTTAQSTGTENTGNAASPNVVTSGGQPSVVREPEQIPETQFSVEEAAEETQEQTAYSGPSVTIDMHDTTVLTGEKIEMMKEQKLDLVLDMGNQMKWTIDADTVRSETFSAIDMGVSMVKGVISQELITDVAGDRNYYEISLAHDGEFGFTAVLQIVLSAEDIGRYANLFYYNPELQELQYVCSSIIDENAVAVFSFEHASDYLIIISDQPMTSGEEDLSEHSDGAVKWIIGLVIILAAGAVVGSILLFCTRRKQEDTEDDDRGDEDDEEDDDGEDDGKDDETDEEYDEDDEKDLTVVHVIDIKQPKAGKQTEKRKLIEKESEELDEYDEYDGYDDSGEYDASEEYDDSEEYGASEEYDDSEEYDVSEKYDDLKERYDNSAENDWIDDDEWEKTKPKETVLQEYTSDEEDDWIDDEEWEEAYHG